MMRLGSLLIRLELRLLLLMVGPPFLNRFAFLNSSSFFGDFSATIFFFGHIDYSL